jgi:hypothetical protein
VSRVAGIITAVTSGADKFVVETPLGFSLCEWFGGAVLIDVGDTIEGDLHSFGFHDLKLTGRYDTVRVWINNFYSSREEAKAFLRGKG